MLVSTEFVICQGKRPELITSTKIKGYAQNTFRCLAYPPYFMLLRLEAYLIHKFENLSFDQYKINAFRDIRFGDVS